MGNIWEGEIQHLPQTVTPKGPTKSSKVKVASTHPPWPEAAGACSVEFAGGGWGGPRPGGLVSLSQELSSWTRVTPAPHLSAPGADRHPAAVGGPHTRQAVLTSSQRALVLQSTASPRLQPRPASTSAHSRPGPGGPLLGSQQAESKASTCASPSGARHPPQTHSGSWQNSGP